MMPRCWTQFGNLYRRNSYIDDAIPLKVQTASKELDALIASCKQLGVTILVRNGKKVSPLERLNFEFETWTPTAADGD